MAGICDFLPSKLPKDHRVHEGVRVARMAECEYIQKCPFFNDRLDIKSADIESLKTKYCRNNNLNCARYMVALSLGPEKMPPNLYPHEKERAYEVIAQG
jgi:hypothetical protein